MELNWRVKSAQFMVISPPISAHWLQHHNHHNREKSPARVEQYQRDMESHQFPVTGDSITFDWNGELINGQHRLEAIWASQIPLETLVVTGLDPEVRPLVDIHGKRSTADAFDFSGMGELIRSGTVSKNTAAGMWARMKHGISNTKGVETRAELIDFAKRYSDGGGFALEQFGKHPRKSLIAVAPVIAAVARAFYNYREEPERYRLANFVEVLCTGMQRHPDDKTIIVWRESLTDSRTGGRNSNYQKELYGKTCRTIQAYMRGDYIARIYCPQDEPFPLPDMPASSAPSTPRLTGMGAGGRRSESRIKGVDLLAAAAPAVSSH